MIKLSGGGMDLPVIHLGGEKCVTGSCHLFQVQGLNILVDCGSAQGHDRALPLGSWPVKVPEQALLGPMLRDAMRFGEFAVIGF
jgi:hypothetical protein